MNWTENKPLRIAILDLYEGEANEGMRCIRQIIREWSLNHHIEVVVTEFDVRLRNEVPDMSYDIFISTGGPGSPLESEGSDWEAAYFGWLGKVETWNAPDSGQPPKHVFLICHSFQLVCRHYKLAQVCRRKSTAFGVFPVHILSEGNHEPIFEGLNDPFYTVDSRDYQAIAPDKERVDRMGAVLLAIEKERLHVPYERAIMAIRFSEYMIGTQFHPEADPEGMSMYLQRADKKATVIAEYGEEKWSSMVEQLQDPDKILSTYHHILPNFLNQAVGELV